MSSPPVAPPSNTSSTPPTSNNDADPRPASPSAGFNAGSSIVMGLVGAISRTFLLLACTDNDRSGSVGSSGGGGGGGMGAEVHGLDGFLALLERREDIAGRERGLLTVSNHVSVVDDPLIWGVLPWRQHWRPDGLRWGLGSHDLCFTNRVLSTFFTLGQVLPTHRAAFSRYGGLFQPTVTETIRILSRGPFQKPSRPEPQSQTGLQLSTDAHHDIPDPFTSNLLTYTTTGTDYFPVPSAYRSRNLGWVHIFPEGKIHQHPQLLMRYFRWGVARLILESEPCPEVVPMWIEGPDQIMHESRTTPRFVPRAGKGVSITFGEPVDTEQVFGDLRRKWRHMRDKEVEGSGEEVDIGIVPKGLMHADEAVKLRKECARRMREEVLKLRRRRGWPDEDPKYALAETWIEGRGPKESWVKDV